MSSEIRVNSLTNRSGLSTVTIADTGAVVAGMITATTFSGPLTGAVTGNVTGNLTGDVTGAVTGDVTGNVTGNTSGTAGGLTGSPSITVADITATGDVSIGGTLTYEDVTNIDSVGIITAQSDVLIGRNLSVTSGISTFKSLDYAAIDSTISDTAVDVFIYDTSKDSDGGAWRKRTQNTSWYNETLGTATRGSRREFPAVAVIVVETSKVTIYDGDDPDLPLWITFPTTTAKGVTALNGELCLCSYASASAYHGLLRINFVADQAINHRESNSATVQGYFIYTLSSTDLAKIDDGPSSWTGYTSEVPNIRNGNCNDITMTVLPNAPIDTATGLPVPTIAVATQGGVSVIKDNGTVVDITSASGGNYNQSKAITITEENYLWWLGDYFSGSTYLRDSYAVSLDNFPSSDFTWSNSTDNLSDGTFYALTTNGEAGEIKIGPGNTWAWNHQERNALGGPAGLAIHKPNIGSENNSIIAAITSDYNTGWMHGDIKGAFLSDTTNATELITNGTFDSNTSGWTAYHSVISVDSNRLRVDDTANAGGWSSAVYEVATVIGKTYQFTFTYTSSSNTFLAGHYAGSYASAGAGTQPTSYTDYGTTSGTYIRIITATTTTTSLVLSVNNDGVSFVDNVSFKLAEADRSVNNNALQVFGTITKSAVATGAELVAYGPFTTSNYLQQPYNSDLNFGTGDFSVMCWIKTTNTGVIIAMSKAPPGSIGAPYFEFQMNGGEIYFVGSNTSNTKTYFGNIADGTWKHICYVRSGGTALGYTNGELYETKVETGNFNHSSNDTLLLGYRQDGYSGTFDGSLALFRISGSAPSAEQIKKIYEDERWLFQENAKATLYGSSDAVTALAFDDDTNLLHVGTSSGRSDFQGLRRINNNTTAVTTAITAQNEFIIEQ